MNDTMAAAVFQEYARSRAKINENGWKMNTATRVSGRAWMAGVLVALAVRLAPSVTDPGRAEVRHPGMPAHA